MRPVLWINLDARADRRAFMEQQFADLGLSADRVAAVTPADLGARVAALSASEQCVTESHRAAWRAIAQSGGDYALILEDDAVLSPALPGFLDDIAPTMAHLDIVRIETGPRRVKLSPALMRAGAVALHRAYSDQWGTAGYIISKACAARLLDEPLVYERALDRCLFDPRGALFAKTEWRQCAPGLCIQGDQLDAVETVWRSDVSAERDEARVRGRVKRSVAQKIGRELGRVGGQVLDAVCDGADAVRGVSWRRIDFARGGVSHT
jgi:glycosyl transferase family 25